MDTPAFALDAAAAETPAVPGWAGRYEAAPDELGTIPLPSSLRVPAASPEALEAQRKWECEGVNRAVRRWRDLQAKAPGTETARGRSIINEVGGTVAAEIAAHQRATEEAITNAPARRRPAPSDPYMLLLRDADALAAIVLNVVLTCAGNSQDHRDTLAAGLSVTRTSRAIARAVKLQAEYGQWVTAERRAARQGRRQGDVYQDTHDTLCRRAKRLDARAAGRWWARLQQMRDAPWPVADEVAFGARLISCLVTGGGGFFCTELRSLPGRRSERVLRLTTLGADFLREHTADIEAAQIMILPAIAPPRPWEWSPERSAYTGGALVAAFPMVVPSRHLHTKATERTIGDTTLRALNVIQDVPWQINRRVLVVLADAWSSGATLGGLERAEPEPTPERVPEPVWARMTAAERRAVKAKLEAIHAVNARAAPRRAAQLECLNVAREMADRSAI
jgi:hypothetical protein